MTIFPKRLQQDQASRKKKKRKPFSSKRSVWTVKADKPDYSYPERGPQRIPPLKVTDSSWKGTNP